MHFSIPDTQEFIDGTGNSYLGYNIHINGLFHCTVRYKQLLHLHDQLAKEALHPLPQFPPKKLFPLTTNQQEERRLCLEKYIQTIGQTSTLNNCTLLNSFLLQAQQETSEKIGVIENLDIFLQNGQRVALKVSTSENSSRVLKKICRNLNLPPEFDRYFALFAIIEGETNANILRRLQDFESPILTLGNINFPAVKVVVGKNYWETENDGKLMENSVALNLLFVQAAAEVKRRWILPNPDEEDVLKELISEGRKKDFLELVRNSRFYGFIQFAPCFCDYPEPNTRVLVAIGKNELNLRMLLENNEEHESVFKVTRMRCWRITTLHNGTENSGDYSLELSFEYLIARNQLQWITIASEQAILMSVSLQGMIDELLVKNSGERRDEGKSWSYVMRDGQTKVVIGEEEKAWKEEREKEDKGKEKSAREKQETFTEVRRVVKGKKLEKKGSKQHCDIMENNAFHMIGDDDL